LSDAALRGAGLSGQKVGYLRDLCARILDGRLQLDELEALPDEAVVERLVAVKGFGRWTARCSDVPPASTDVLPSAIWALSTR
jgi:DNA-3-methyladenine glycosylase II